MTGPSAESKAGSPSSFGLLLYLALKGIRFHRMVALITIIGVALGMLVIATILIVDHNTSRSEEIRNQRDSARHQAVSENPQAANLPAIESLHFIRQDGDEESISLVPAQSAADARVDTSTAAQNRIGEADYQAMRLAVRLASVFAFAVGAVIVFYTMRFSVASRRREFALLLTLGQQRGSVIATLILEAVLLGGLGLIIGGLLALPMAERLLAWGVTTTGRSFIAGVHIPYVELAVVSLSGIAVALAGVAGPARTLWTMSVRDVFQPRFVTDGDNNLQAIEPKGLFWLLPPLTVMAYLMVRPFLQDWLSVVTFFLVEAGFVTAFSIAVLTWVRPVLRGLIRLFEWTLGRILPLETLLAGRRMRMALRQFTFTIVSVVLVFSMVVALQGIANSLKGEIANWANQALYPYVHYYRVLGLDDQLHDQVIEDLAKEGVYFMRLSPKGTGVLPLRLILAKDFNRMRKAEKKPAFGPGQVILSTALARRYQLQAGDHIELLGADQTHRFDVVEVTDRYGYYPIQEQYIDMRTYALFSDGNPVFANNMEKHLGRFAVARRIDGYTRPDRDAILSVAPHFQTRLRAVWLGYRQQQEIDRDFLIFDFIMLFTVILAAVGVANTLLIQVRAREREFSIYRVVGMGRLQLSRLLLMEGLLIGLVGAFLAVILGTVLGAISVAFLDRFTLFELRYFINLTQLGYTGLGVLLISILAALYPAFSATRVSSSESLHYE